MTKMIQIRDVDDTVHAELRARAARVGLSLSDYLRGELERIAARPPMADVMDRAARREGGVATSQVVAAVREERDAR